LISNSSNYLIPFNSKCEVPKVLPVTDDTLEYVL